MGGARNEGVRLFWPIFGAVLGANLLTVCFVWAAVNVSRRESAGQPIRAYMPALIMPLLFCGVALMIAFDRTALFDSVLR